MSSHDDVRNAIERAAEAKFPGYRGTAWGEYTPASEVIQLPRRTQVAFADGSVYWLDVPAGSILPGDMITVLERGLELRKVKKADRYKITVQVVGMTLPGEYFEKPDAIPHRFGTFMELHRGSNG